MHSLQNKLPAKLKSDPKKQHQRSMLGWCMCAGDVQAYLDLPHPATNPNCYPIASTSAALGLQQPVDSAVWTPINACLLVFMLVAVRVATYMALRRKTTQL